MPAAQDLAEVLAPLTVDGWYFLHDRANPFGGNIDTIAIGPAGVVVMDAKAWNGQLSVVGDRLKVGGWSKQDQIDKVKGQAAAVQHAIADEVAVAAGLVFTTQPAFGPHRVADVAVTGTDHVLPALRTMPAVLTAAVVERLFRTLSEAFPPMGTAPSAASGQKDIETFEASRQFERANRLLYVKPWKGGGRERLYLNTEHGVTLGYRDVVTGAVHLEPSCDEPFARTVLDAATVSGVTLDRASIPRIKLEMPAGRLLGVMGKLWVTVVIGQEWRKRGKHLLYGTVANPTEGVHRLGYVDLDTGWVKPETEGRISDLLRPAEDYLVQLRDRFPRSPA